MKAHYSPALAVTAEATGAVDPVIQSLLKNARSEAVRQEFLRMPADEYTSKHDVSVLVCVQSIANSMMSNLHDAADQQYGLLRAAH